MIYCGGCKHLSPTEEEQDKMAVKVSHRCEKINRVLHHFDVHPQIVRHPDCPGYEYESE